MDTSISLKTTKLKTPFVLLSGTVSKKILKFVDPKAVGGVTLKTVTENPKQPNPAPRMWDFSYGVINSIGLFNPGVDKFLNEELPEYLKLDFFYMISVGGFDLESFKTTIEKVSKKVNSVDKVIGIELNVSCPNVKKGGISFSGDREAIKTLTSHAGKFLKKEIWVKLSPVGDIVRQAGAALEGGATSLVIANTIPAAAVDPVSGKTRLGEGFGGLSGPALKPINLMKVRKVYRKYFPLIVASGGILSFEDVLEYRHAGASLFGLGTALFKDPRTPNNLYEDLKNYLKNQSKAIEDFLPKEEGE